MDEPVSLPSIAESLDSLPTTLIGSLRQDYLDAMRVIDTDSANEIRAGQEMKGLMSFLCALRKLTEIHEQLSTFYVIIYRNQGILKRNGSERISQLGHEMLPTLELLSEYEKSGYSDEEKIVKKFHNIGLHKPHWYCKERFLQEIEYMLDALTILIEPNFMPIVTVDSSITQNETDRYIPSEVKLSVWRRDQGKCVECGTKEKLEYDHIIPVSKGGSNTDRNVQLLCQTCNRKKAAAIQ